MSEPNPYQAPATPVTPAAAPEVAFSASGRAVDTGRGWDWIVEAYALLKKQLGTWILAVIVLLIYFILTTFMPIISTLANMFLMQVFIGGAMLGCRALDSGERFGSVFVGFKHKIIDLVVVGLIAMVVGLILFLPVIAIGSGVFMDIMRGGELASTFGRLGLTLLLALLVALALGLTQAGTMACCCPTDRRSTRYGLPSTQPTISTAGASRRATSPPLASRRWASSGP